MKTLSPIVFILLTAAVLPSAAKAGDAEGCVDLKLFPRLEGCIIQECSARQNDSFEAGDASGAPLDANTNSLAYSCPVGDPQKMRRDFEALLRKAGYQSVAEDQGDAASLSLTARKNSRWIYWSANSEDGAGTYSLTTASGGAEKFKAEACGPAPVWSAFKQCEVVECASKSEDTVAMRSAQQEQTSLTGNVQTLALACPLLSAAQAFSAMEVDLKASGFEILFSDREHPESGWMTGRAGKKWVELVSVPDGESVSYALTVVPSAEVLTAAKTEPPPAPDTTPAAVAAPEPAVQIVEQPAAPRAPVLPPLSAPMVATPFVARPDANPPAPPKFFPPKAILQVPIEATHDRIYSVMGDVVINLLVDVGEDGAVTKAELAGHITKDVLQLQSAALDAVSHWRFEPARQDGQPVASAKIAVQMHFHGRPWRY